MTGGGIELRHLEALVAVADEGSVTRAAARLHLAQPAVSRTLRQLEQRLGATLLERSSSGAVPTEAGAAVLDDARAALAAVDRMRSTAPAARRPLVLGYSWGAAGAAPAGLVASWRHAHPDRPVTWRRIDHRLAGLLDASADVALLRGDLTAPGDAPVPVPVATLALGHEQRVAALPREHPLVGRASLDLDDLADEQIVVNRVGGITHPELWPARRRPHVARTVAHTDDWLLAIAGGEGVGVTTTTTAVTATHPDVVYVPMPGAPLVPLRLAWRTDRPQHPDLRALLRHASALTRSSGGSPPR
jgi:DNA-binding transcriptional LysR family regulator